MPTPLEVRQASATYVNRVGYHIQAVADDAGWHAAQAEMELAHTAHREGEFVKARAYIDAAFRTAFGLPADAPVVF